MNVRAVALMVVAGSVLALAGCPAAVDPDDYTQAPETYVSLARLVAEHNANAAKVPRLWARAEIALKLPDGMPVDTGGVLMLAKTGSPVVPANFVLIGQELTELFRVGVDARSGAARARYYLWYKVGDRSQAWLGRCRLAGAPNVQAVPIDPMQLVEILGVTELPAVAAGKMPAIVMRLEGRPAAYVVRYLRPQPTTGELKIWREVSFAWSDAKPRRPFRVRLFDADGLCRVVADVGEYRPIQWQGPQDQAPPVMPTDLKIRWPKIKGVQPASSLHMVLSEITTKPKGRLTVFDFAGNLPRGIPVTLLDATYGPDAEEKAAQ